MLKPGEIIDGKYKILSEVGRGGMSTVYLAINEKANKPWAVKEVRKSGISNSELVKQSLLMEINLLKKLKNKGLPSIIDIIDQSDNYLIVMDYIEGITLEKLLQEEGAQPQEKVVDWAIRLCDVLQYLHTREPAVIYRDMKPSNIMLRSDGSVVLIDFGTAREFKEKHAADTTCLGTQGYAAPEQFGGMGQTDERTDIYSLGATLYRLVTGHDPSQPPYEMYPITHWNARLSTGLEGIIRRCTCKNPQDRYQTIAEVKYALGHYRDLDVSSLRGYRRNLRILTSVVTLTVMLFSVSGISFAAASNMQKDEYQYNLEAGKRSTSKEESISFYQKAIETDSGRSEAYEQLLELFTQDGNLDEEEEKVLLQLTISVEKYLEKYKVQNPQEYAGLCYQIGSSYWYYYEHEEKRQSGAVAWFESAAAGFAGRPDKETEYKRAQTYIEIGNFYRKILPAQISGTDMGMYGEYWENLKVLKQMNDEQPDRDLMTLRLYREIVTRTLEYAGYLLEDGVSAEEMEDMMQQIRIKIHQIRLGASQSVMQEIEELEEVLIGADEMLASCKWKGARK